MRGRRRGRGHATRGRRTGRSRHYDVAGGTDGPQRHPPEVRTRLAAAFETALATPEVHALLDRIGVDAAPMSAAQTADWLARHQKRWSAVIAQHKISAR